MFSRFATLPVLKMSLALVERTGFTPFSTCCAKKVQELNNLLWVMRTKLHAVKKYPQRPTNLHLKTFRQNYLLEQSWAVFTLPTIRRTHSMRASSWGFISTRTTRTWRPWDAPTVWFWTRGWRRKSGRWRPVSPPSRRASSALPWSPPPESRPSAPGPTSARSEGSRSMSRGRSCPWRRACLRAPSPPWSKERGRLVQSDTLHHGQAVPHHEMLYGCRAYVS